MTNSHYPIVNTLGIEKREQYQFFRTLYRKTHRNPYDTFCRNDGNISVIKKIDYHHETLRSLCFAMLNLKPNSEI